MPSKQIKCIILATSTNQIYPERIGTFNVLRKFLESPKIFKYLKL